MNMLPLTAKSRGSYVKFIHPAHKNKLVCWYIYINLALEVCNLLGAYYIGYINSGLCMYLGEQNGKFSKVYNAKYEFMYEVNKTKITRTIFLHPPCHIQLVSLFPWALVVCWPLFLFFKLQAYQKPCWGYTYFTLINVYIV